ncbi:hypothetical protein Tco_0176445, partial [Tanacetum coccineum]
MENPNHLNELNEAIPEVNPIVPEPDQVVDIHDPNDIDLVDYDEEDPEEDPKEDPEEEPKKDVEIELEDDAYHLLLVTYLIIDNLAPWALRRDLEASHTQARVMEAELGTCQTEIALLKSKNKTREKERELLNHDLENVKRALGNVLER